GTPRSTVHDQIGAVRNFQSGKTGQPGLGEERPYEPPPAPHPFAEKLRDMHSERGERWWAAYRALQAIDACASVMSPASALLEAVIVPSTLSTTDADPLGYVISVNLHRRHLREPALDGGITAGEHEGRQTGKFAGYRGADFPAAGCDHAERIRAISQGGP